MKYHSTSSTVIISIAIAFLFLLVAVFILSSLNVTSPTLMLTNRIFESWKNVDSNISIEFSSIERNLRDRVFINGLTIKYANEEVVYFDTLRLDRGLFSMIGYILSGSGTLKISAENGRVSIPNISSSASSGEEISTDILTTPFSLSIPEELLAWGVELDFRNVDIEYGDLIINTSMISMYFDHSFDGFYLETEIPDFSYNINGFDIASSDISLDFRYSNGFAINANISNGQLNSDNVSIDISNFAFNAGLGTLTNIVPLDIPLTASYDSISILNGSNTIRTGKSTISIIDRNLSMEILDSNAAIDQYAGNIQRLSLDTSNFIDYVIDIEKIALKDKEDEIALIDYLSLGLDIDGKEAMIDVPALDIPIVSSFTNGLIDNINISALTSRLNYSNGIHLTLDASAVASSNDSLFSGTAFDFGIDGSFVNNALSYDINIDNLKTTEMPDSLSLNISGNENDVLISIGYKNMLSGSVGIRDNIDAELSFNDLALDDFRSFVNHYIPAFNSYISSDTALNGYLSATIEKDLSARLGMTGNMSYDLNLEKISFNDNSFDLSTNIDVVLSADEFTFNDFAIKTDWIDITYDGNISFISNLPEGHFEILGSKNGDRYFILDMTASNLREYTFYSESPYISDSYITGVVDFSTDNLITSDAVISIFNRINPFDLRIELDNKLLTMNNDSIDIDVSWLDILDISMKFDALALSPVDRQDVITTLDGHVGFTFDFAMQQFILDIPRISVSDLYASSTEPTFSFSAYGNNASILFSDISFTATGYNPLSGSALLDIQNRSLALNISDGENENYLVSVFSEDDSYFGILRGENIDLDRFGLADMTGSLNLTGRAERLMDFSFSGTFNASGSDIENDPRAINASIYIDNNQVDLTDFIYTNNSLSLSIPYLSFNGKEGFIDMESANALLSFSHTDRDYTISAGISANIDMISSNSLIESVFSLISNRGAGSSLSLNMDYLDVDNSLHFENRSLFATFDGSRLVFSGDLANGSYDTSLGLIDCNINLDPIAVFSVNGNLREPNGSSFKINIDKFAVSVTNFVFPSPILVFYNPGYLAGEVNIVLQNDGIDVFGQLNTENAEFDVWWLTNERVILHNTTFSIWDNDIVSVLSDATVLNTETYERVPAKISLGIYFDDSFGFDSWDLDVYIDDPYSINFRMPVLSSNMDMKGKVSGHYRIDASNGIINNSGELTVDDVILSIGMDALPSWWRSTFKTTSDFDILLRRNAQLVYPLGPNPILRANVADNTQIRFSLDEKSSFNISGDITLRAGEIFYFQKYFYITEGTVGFRNGSAGLDPIINLRARLRDFDSEGERVDIYLILRDATLDNISPTFESSPNKDLNEIMSILGQAILPTTAYGDTSFTTVVSMAAASVDLLSKVGIIGSVDSGLNSTIRDSLSIDTFSLHTNILSNLVTETVLMAESSRSFNNLSPMARYLDGTSLYLGKYITPNVYLQAMVHLSANRTNEKNRFSFISDDLYMDTELSLEWTNPLCTVTFFSQPIYLTPYGLMDNFGFSLTKRIVF